MWLDGKSLAQEIESDLRVAVEHLKNKKALSPGLSLINLSNYEDNARFISIKNKRAQALGIQTSVSDTNVIDAHNADQTYHGILVQLPIKKQYEHLLHKITIDKDVDGLSYINHTRLVRKEKPFFVPPTPLGCLWLLQRFHPRPLDGEIALVIGRSFLVGKPMADILTNSNATVILAHSHTKNLHQLVSNADIIVTATGQEDVFDPKYCKKDTTIIDVGFFIGKDGKLRGDMPKNIIQYVARATPVPNGVGPLTISGLLFNTIKSAYDHQNIALHPSLGKWQDLIP